MAKMSDLHRSIIIRPGILMLRRSILICVISGLRVVNVIVGHFFVTTPLFTNIRKQFACI